MTDKSSDGNGDDGNEGEDMEAIIFGVSFCVN